MKAKKEYYNACKLDRASAAQENTLKGVADTPADQVFISYFTLHQLLYYAYSLILTTLCLKKKTSPFLFLWYLSQISCDSANCGQNHAPGNFKQAHVHTWFKSHFVCSYCTL